MTTYNCQSYTKNPLTRLSSHKGNKFNFKNGRIQSLLNQLDKLAALSRMYIIILDF